ncbi:hypothetical protein D917_04829, partial [Trichinella nativa]
TTFFDNAKQQKGQFNEFFLQFQCEGVNSDAQVLMRAGVGLKFSPDELVYGGRCNQTRRLANSKKTTCPRFRSLNRTRKTNKLQMRSSPIVAESTSTALRLNEKNYHEFTGYTELQQCFFTARKHTDYYCFWNQQLARVTSESSCNFEKIQPRSRDETRYGDDQSNRYLLQSHVWIFSRMLPFRSSQW